MDLNFTPFEISQIDAPSFAKSFSAEKPLWSQTVGVITAIDAGGNTVSVKVNNQDTVITGVKYMNHYSPKVNAVVVIKVSGSDVYIEGGLAGNGGAVAAGRVEKTAAQNFTSGTTATVTFSATPTFDPFGMWTSGTNAWTIPFDGVWLLSAGINFDTNTTGYRDVRILRGAALEAIVRHAPTGATTYLQINHLTTATVGQTFVCQATQLTSPAVTLAMAAVAYTHFTATYMGSDT